MSNIYEDGPERAVDLAKAIAQLAQSGAINNDGVRRSTVAEISTAALLDIAGSLRVIAAEAALAMAGSGSFTLDGMPEAEAPMTDDTRDFLVVGDRVTAKADDDREVGRVTGVGVTEGEPYADVAFEQFTGRLFARDLERVTSDETEDAIDLAAMRSHEDARLDPEGDDFTPPASALDALKDLEAKPAKKKAAKK